MPAFRHPLLITAMSSVPANARCVSDPVSWYRLILYPGDAALPPVASANLAAVLADTGLAGESFHHRGLNYFLPGERFLDLIVFLGCSPVIELQRQDDEHGEPQMDRFCHIHVAAPLPAPRLHVGDVGSTPRCPSCRAPIAQWQQALSAWQEEPMRASWHCPACGASAAAAQIQWRQAAAVLRCGVELGGIHPFEAIPADELLSALERATSQPWRYYYVRPQS